MARQRLVTSAPTLAEGRREFRSIVGWLTLVTSVAATVVGAIITPLGTMNMAESWAMVLSFALFAWVGLVLVVAHFWHRAFAERQRKGWEWERRQPRPHVPPPLSTSGDRTTAPHSRRQTQRDFYGDDHPGLTYRDRQLAETLGMDADTYVSNYLESD
ncbi:hypothetical protein ACFWGN_15015 [Oerskovia sp. NPDC060338]|uniref:hypothetical protein n=1 Tax=Oerskovia sp. NPDC060338 TaxID=3347100 RepID=UPI003654CD49